MFSIPRQSTRNPSLVRSAARSQQGMTLLEIMIVLAIIAVVMGFLVGPRVLGMFQDSKKDTTKLIIKQLVYQDYLMWSQATGESCPSSLKDLEKYRNSKDTKDGWGNELVVFCGDNAPDGAPNGFAVLSKGPDGKQGTEDDIKSWD